MDTGTTKGRLDSWFRVAQAIGVDIGELFRVL